MNTPIAAPPLQKESVPTTNPAAVLISRRSALGILSGSVATAVLERALARNTEPVQRQRADLEHLVPQAFGHWTVNANVAPVQPSPELLEKVQAIYDETLNRTYANARTGSQVMLSIAYGGDQTGRLRVHRPESCYSAQGFQVKKLREEIQTFDRFRIPVKRLHAVANNRSEPITYWIRIGDTAVTGNVGQRLEQLKYGLTGEVPDGLLFRVSSISNDVEEAFQTHNQFVADMAGSLSPRALKVLAGSTGQQPTTESS